LELFKQLQYEFKLDQAITDLKEQVKSKKNYWRKRKAWRKPNQRPIRTRATKNGRKIHRTANLTKKKQAKSLRINPTSQKIRLMRTRIQNRQAKVSS
jgi:hypothetical protein